jgi:hypothetical protein
MMHSADVAIIWPLGCLHQFGSTDLEGALSVWGTGESLVAPNQDYREVGEECVSNVWLGIKMQQQYSKLEKHLRGLCFHTVEDVQEEVKRWYIFRMHHCATKAFSLWPTAMKSASTDIAITSRNRMHMCLYPTHVLLTKSCLYCK